MIHIYKFIFIIFYERKDRINNYLKNTYILDFYVYVKLKDICFE